jgi:hypothetical protein
MCVSLAQRPATPHGRQNPPQNSVIALVGIFFVVFPVTFDQDIYYIIKRQVKVLYDATTFVLKVRNFHIN